MSNKHGHPYLYGTGFIVGVMVSQGSNKSKQTDNIQMRLIRPTQRGNTHMCCGMMYTIKSRKTANLRGGVFAKIPQDLDEHPSAWLVNMRLSWIRTTPVHKCLVQSNLYTLFALNHARMHNKAKHFFGLLKSNLLSDPGWCCTTENLQTQ